MTPELHIDLRCEGCGVDVGHFRTWKIADLAIAAHRSRGLRHNHIKATVTEISATHLFNDDQCRQEERACATT